MKQFCKSLHQTVILLWRHDAEADKAIVQEGEGGAIADHQSLSDTMVKQKICIHIILQNFYQNKVSHRPVDFHRVPGGKQLVESAAFAVDQFLCLAYIFFILKHQSAGNLGQRIDGPRVLAGIDLFDQILISRYCITETQSGRCEEFGSSPKDDQVRI